MDALYQAYLAALLGGAGVLLGASAVGDAPVTDTTELVVAGPRWVGAAVAVLVAMGLRSGARGGPLAVEQADVRHVLLAPVDRTTALRGPLVHQLRFLLFVAAAAGTAAGVLADRRLPGHGPVWAACGALLAVSAVALAHGAAAVTSGLRIKPWIAGLVGLVLVTWTVGDAVQDGAWLSPARFLGGIALWPIRFEVADLVLPVLAVAAVTGGLLLIGGVSVERLERRSRLVGQARFAATLQDVRTVLVLRRQLAQERPRNKPWIRLPLPRRAFPVLVRDVRSLLRWPVGRAIRLLLLATVAGLAGRGAWDGTTPLLLVEGLALFLVGLDAAEPLGQELDHPSRRDLVPRPMGWLYVRHFPVVVVVSVLVALVAAAVGVLVHPIPGAWSVALVCAVPAGIGAACGGVVNLVMGPPSDSTSGQGAWSLAPPEAAGMRIAIRTGWPPALAILGTTPLLAARNVLDGAGEAGPLDAAFSAATLLYAVLALTGGWLLVREDLQRWWRRQSEQVQAQMKGDSDDEGAAA